jgi:hypothetical protein
VLDHTGKLVSDSSIGRERCGANLASYGAVSVVANVDGDPKTTQLQVVCGNRALRRDGAPLGCLGGPRIPWRGQLEWRPALPVLQRLRGRSLHGVPMGRVPS